MIGTNTTVSSIYSVHNRRRRHANQAPSRFAMMTTTTTTTPREPDRDAYIDMNNNDGPDLQNEVTPSPTDTFSATASSTNHNHNIVLTTPNVILYNFIFMSILFSSNHGCVVACLSLATARLGSLGAYQNGLLYVIDVLAEPVDIFSLYQTKVPHSFYVVFCSCDSIPLDVDMSHMRFLV